MSAADLDIGSEDLAEAAARMLVGGRVDDLRQVGGGRNSRVFRVESDRGIFALKQYPSPGDDPRDRLGTEAAALRWMEAEGIDVVPRLVALDRELNFALLSWAEGELVEDVAPADIDQALAFLAGLHGRRGAARIPPNHLAAEACPSGAEIVRQVRRRAAHLGALTGEEALQAFLAAEFAPALEALVGVARRRVEAAGLDFAAELDARRRSLVPSDFGFHNALRAGDGRLTFIDFEYFGWDDPVKLTADMLLHPGTALGPALKRRFRSGALELYGDDPDFAVRLDAYHPLFGLRWVLILLNEFHPERWRRRVLAGAKNDWAEAKAGQLAKAQALLSQLMARS